MCLLLGLSIWHILTRPGLFFSIAYLQLNNSRCATQHVFQSISSINDLEVYFKLDNIFELNSSIFVSHWSHLSISIHWFASIIFHIGWNDNYELWISNPINNLSIAHGVFDQHFGLGVNEYILF